MEPTSAIPAETLLAHASWVEGLARRLVLDPSAADDVVQEAWLEVLERPPRHAGSPRGFLATVVRNAARRLGRGEARRREREHEVARPERVLSTAEVAARAALQRDLVDRVLGLDEPYREVVLLSFFEGLSTSAVAERLGRPRNTVQTQLQRALERLRTRLDAAYGDRRAWGLALLPLARGRHAAEVAAAQGSVLTSTVPTVIGGWIMLLKGTLVVSGAALAAVWGWNRIAEEPAPPAREVAHAVAAPALELPAEIEEIAAPVASEQRVALAAPAAEPEEGPAVVRMRVSTGRVVDLTGQPVGGVEVRSEPPDYALPRRADGQLWFGDRGVRLDELQDQLALDPDALQTVFPHLDERYLEGALALVRGEEFDWGHSTTLTGADGRYELRRPQGDGDPTVFAPPLELIGRATGDGPEGLETLLIVSEVARVTALVVDEHGTPVTGAHVHATMAFPSIPDFPYSFRGGYAQWGEETDANGRADLGTMPRVEWLRVHAVKRGYDSDSLYLTGEGPAELRFTLTPSEPRTVAGRVFHADGSPAAGVRVYFGQDQALAGEDGSFSIHVTTLRPGAALAASAKGFEPAILPGLADAMRGDEDSRAGLLLHLGGPTASLRGLVTDAEGEPLTDVALSLVDPTPLVPTSTWFAEQAQAETDGQGRFELAELAHRPYRLRVVDRMSTRAFLTEPLWPDTDAVLAFPEKDELFPLTGRVVDTRGVPVADADVTLVQIEARWTDPSGSANTDTLDVQIATTGPDGAFAFAGVTPLMAVTVHGEGLRYRLEPLEGRDASSPALELVVDLLHRFRLTSSRSGPGPRYEFHGPDGAVTFRAQFLDGRADTTSLLFGERPSEPLLEVSAEATELVLFDGERETRRIRLQGTRGEIASVSLDG